MDSPSGEVDEMGKRISPQRFENPLEWIEKQKVQSAKCKVNGRGVIILISAFCPAGEEKSIQFFKGPK